MREVGPPVREPECPRIDSDIGLRGIAICGPGMGNGRAEKLAPRCGRRNPPLQRCSTRHL